MKPISEKEHEAEETPKMERKEHETGREMMAPRKRQRIAKRVSRRKARRRGRRY